MLLLAPYGRSAAIRSICAIRHNGPRHLADSTLSEISYQSSVFVVSIRAEAVCFCQWDHILAS